ncbi:hypothetical protein Lpp120_2520 [Lacticaseibacillus paracasei subsp. paracasei Lpp120]|nr:hypothetical protein Lpp120_2520 [Lacticaseibacillus paracasei subsp. paracasei Lpp120]
MVLKGSITSDPVKTSVKFWYEKEYSSDNLFRQTSELG